MIDIVVIVNIIHVFKVDLCIAQNYNIEFMLREKMDVKISNNIAILIMGKRKIKQGQVLITFKDGKKIEYVMISKLVDEKLPVSIFQVKNID